VNGFFQSDQDPHYFFNLIDRARKFDLPGVVSIDTALDLLERKKRNPELDLSLSTPWPNVNRLTKGFHAGDLVIVSALAKTGKTSWCLDIARDLVKQGIPTLFYCLEMRPERLVSKVIQAEYETEDPSLSQIEWARNAFSGWPLYFAHAFKKPKLEDVLALIRKAIQRYDLRLVIFDNLHFLVRSVSNVNEEIGQAVQGFKLMAEEMEIPVIAIAQPRKRDVRSDEIMSAEDIKYSNSVHADCDQMIILHRKRIASKVNEINPDGFTAKSEAMDPVTLVRAEAHRYGPGGETLLYFHGEYSRFDQLRKKQGK